MVGLWIRKNYPPLLRVSQGFPRGHFLRRSQLVLRFQLAGISSNHDAASSSGHTIHSVSANFLRISRNYSSWYRNLRYLGVYRLASGRDCHESLFWFRISYLPPHRDFPVHGNLRSPSHPIQNSCSPAKNFGQNPRLPVDGPLFLPPLASTVMLGFHSHPTLAPLRQYPRPNVSNSWSWHWPERPLATPWHFLGLFSQKWSRRSLCLVVVWIFLPQINFLLLSMDCCQK